MAQETEVKFMVESGNPGDVIDWAESAGLLSGRPVQLHLDNYYYDTPDFILRQAGIALRVRCSDDSWEATIKTRAGGNEGKNGGVHIHPEYTVPLPGQPEYPDLGIFPGEIFRDLPSGEIQERLTRIMSQRCVRTIFNVFGTTPLHEDFIIEISFDEVVYQGKNGDIPGRELELELKEGGSGALLYVAAILLEAEKAREMPLKLRTGSVSKMERAAIYAGLAEAGTPSGGDLSSDRGICQTLAGLERRCFLESDSIRAAQAFRDLGSFFREISESPVSSSLRDNLKILARDYYDKKLPDLPLAERKKALKLMLTAPDLVLARLRLELEKSL
ncbi:inorganic triphosphatase [Succinimonas amylolytica]|uniref:CYTH domain-containing protein n=1 Tax=Succinimonas amylolytica TaxID=83769 RepID=UPI0023A820D7